MLTQELSLYQVNIEKKSGAKKAPPLEPFPGT